MAATGFSRKSARTDSHRKKPDTATGLAPATGGMRIRRPRRMHKRLAAVGLVALFGLGLLTTGGCWAPLVSHGVPARNLPDEFRTPFRTAGPPLNFASLSIPPQADYILGPDDVLEVTIHGLYPGGETRPIRALIMANGEVYLPLVGAVHVGDMNVMQAHAAVHKAYADGFIQDPRTSVYLAEKSMTNVMVLGEVGNPGIYALPKYENDVAHALAAAGGLREDAGSKIEVHCRNHLHFVSAGGSRTEGPPSDPAMGIVELPPPTPVYPKSVIQSMHFDTYESLPATTYEPLSGASYEPLPGTLPGQENMRIVKIPLRGFPDEPLSAADIVLHAGDVVVVPSRKYEVFYVVGPLSKSNFTRFTIGLRERDIGAGFLLPADREIDVVTAVTMAGYIDPIESPTTVTVQRHCPDGRSLLIIVDLIKARYDPKETVLVAPGDIIYLNPDAAWWGRRTFDRIIVDLFRISYRHWLGFNN